jgi:hypothetical protein
MSGYNLHVFSSDKLAWSTHVKCFNTTEGQALSMLRSEAVVCRGYAHWLFSSVSNFHVLNVEVLTGNVSLTKVLSPTPGDRFNVQDNYIATAMQWFLDSLEGGLWDVDRLTTTADGTLLTLCV